MTNFYIYLAVVVSGAAVLAVEILGTRILAPFYGASIYLWSALISVTLAALSVGYAFGGRWADRGPRLNRLALVIGLAGLWIALIPWIRLPVLTISEAAGLRLAVLITSAILFFPPLALLGVVSPYAIRLKVSSLDVVGSTAGNLYSVSTVASVVAAVATGFLLIPNVGVSRLIFLIGFALVGTSVVGFVLWRAGRAALVAILIVAGTGIPAYKMAPAEKPDPDGGLLAIVQSAYGELRVVDQDGLRYLLIDGGTHTVVDPLTWESQFRYVNVLDLMKGFFHEPSDILLVGLGGGSVVKSYFNDGWHVDAVDIDPAIVDLAHEYFGLQSGEADVHVMDARQYLLTTDKSYDLIALDAFGSSSIPFHLVTVEAFGLVKSRLRPGGIVAMNIEAVGWDDVLARSLAATLNGQFQYVITLPIAEPPNQIGNLVLAASDRPLELEEEPPVPTGRFTAGYDRAHAWDNRFGPDSTDNVLVLTDDLNPVGIWAERVNLAARKKLHSFFRKRGVAW